MTTKTKDIEKEIREQWFKDHKATITEGAVIVIDWRIGNYIPYRVQAYLIGLKMISEMTK